MSALIEERGRLRSEDSLADSVVVVRGGRDSIDKLRRHAQRAARGPGLWTECLC